MSLLPSRPDASPPDDADPRVIGVDSEDADDVLSALSSRTARELLDELHHDPAPPSDLAERVDTSVQNVQYHLENLENAGAVEVVDTAYSAKGREMDVYAPSDQPLVIFAGDEGKESTLKTALTRLLGSVGILGLASLAIQSVFGESLFPWQGETVDAEEYAKRDTEGDAAGDAGDSGGGATTESSVENGSAEAPVEEGTNGGDADVPDGASDADPEVIELTPEEFEALTETATTLPPGLLFFAGGVFTLAVVGAVLYLR